MKKICSLTTISSSMQSFMLPEMIALHTDGWESIVITNISESLSNDIPSYIKAYSVPMERSYKLFLAIKCIHAIYKILRREKPDIVQYGTTHACLFGSIAAFFARVPHRMFLQWGNIGYDDYKGIRRFFMMSIERLISLLSTEVRAQSPKNMDWSIADNIYSEKKASVVGKGGTIGVDLHQYKLERKQDYRNKIRKCWNIHNDDFVFGFVGRICKPKGVNELFEAFKQISKCNNCKLMLMGANEDKGDIEQYSWAKEASNVIFTGMIPHSEIQQYFAAIDVLVHPTYREGFGMVLQEAMALEVPIITTDIPGPSEVIENGISGMLVNVKDSKSLFSVMKDACNNKEKWLSYGKNGRKRAEQHFERNHRLALLVEDKNKILNSKNV